MWPRPVSDEPWEDQKEIIYLFKKDGRKGTWTGNLIRACPAWVWLDLMLRAPERERVLACACFSCVVHLLTLGKSIENAPRIRCAGFHSASLADRKIKSSTVPSYSSTVQTTTELLNTQQQQPSCCCRGRKNKNKINLGCSNWPGQCSFMNPATCYLSILPSYSNYGCWYSRQVIVAGQSVD